MATQIPDPSLLFSDFAGSLLTEREVIPRARLIANRIAEAVPGAAIVVYVIEDRDQPEWTPKAVVGDVKVAHSKIPLEAGTLGEVAKTREPFACESSALAREDYDHLDIRRTLLSLAYIPLIYQEVLVGALEILSFEISFGEDTLTPVLELADSASVGIASALSYESERNSNLRSISRLAQLYDIEKVLNSTLEMDELLQIIASKFGEILNVQAVNLWMIGAAEELTLVSRYGFDPAAEAGAIQRPGDGPAGDVSEEGDPLLIESSDDPRLVKRNSAVEEGKAFSLMAAAIVDRESLVGVVEAVNRMDGRAFDEDDLSLLVALCETAAGALHNASLLQAERKVEILETLVSVSKEITSTLNLDRVLQAVVNHTQTIIAFERAAIALEQRGSLELKAISGTTLINAADPQVKLLKDMLEWASISPEETYVTQHGEEIDDPRPETRSKFAEYFAQTGMRAFYALPLIDDQGRLGLFSFESSDPDFLTAAHLEIVKVLAGQTTVAVRNASLYREVPFIDVLEPLLRRKQRFMAMEKRRRALTVAAAVALLLFLIFCPWPMRVEGNAVVVSAHTAQIQPEVEGVVKRVLVREGSLVKNGDPLAELEDWNFRADLAAAQAKYGESMETMNHALAQNDGGAAGSEHIKGSYWKAEVARAQQRLDHAIIRAPFDGIITTPQVENFAGRHLGHDDTFAEIADTARVTINVAVAEDEAALVRRGEHAAIKLESFPTRTFSGDVTVLGPRSEIESDARVFFARVDVPNSAGDLHPGMQGHGKISAGWHPAGYVFLRGPGLWIWNKLWSWFGW